MLHKITTTLFSILQYKKVTTKKDLGKLRTVLQQTTQHLIWTSRMKQSLKQERNMSNCVIKIILQKLCCFFMEKRGVDLCIHLH
jgi:hypothetical protein